MLSCILTQAGTDIYIRYADTDRRTEMRAVFQLTTRKAETRMLLWLFSDSPYVQGGSRLSVRSLREVSVLRSPFAVRRSAFFAPFWCLEPVVACQLQWLLSVSQP